MKRHYAKVQSQFTVFPAVITAHRADWSILIRIAPPHPARQSKPEVAEIWLDPLEAQGFASWLSAQADHMIDKQARAAARKAARAAAKKGGEL